MDELATLSDRIKVCCQRASIEKRVFFARHNLPNFNISVIGIVNFGFAHRCSLLLSVFTISLLVKIRIAVNFLFCTLIVFL